MDLPLHSRPHRRRSEGQVSASPGLATALGRPSGGASSLRRTSVNRSGDSVVTRGRFAPVGGVLVAEGARSRRPATSVAALSFPETPMRAMLLMLTLVTTLASAADSPRTMAEQSQAKARKVLDTAVKAIGGAEALQSIEVVRLQLQGENWPRLQSTTPRPPFAPGQFQETLLLDIKDNRLFLDQRFSNAGFDGHNTVVIQSGEGTTYDHRARTATPIPPAQATQQQLIQYYRRLPNLILRQALDRANTLRYLGEDTFEGRRQQVVTFVMADTQQVALYVDAKTGLVSKYELIFTDPLRGEQASQIIFGNYASMGKLKVPQSWSWRIAGDLAAQYKVNAEF